MGMKDTIERTLGGSEWSRIEQRLIAEIEDVEAQLDKSKGRKLDPSDYETLLGQLTKAEVDARADLYAASSRGDGEACQTKGGLQRRAQAVRARLIGNQFHGASR